MRIAFSVDGGVAVFPGLARPTTIDVDDLPVAEAARVGTAVERSRFFDRPEPATKAAAGAADLRRYVITVDDGGRHRTLTVAEGSGDADLEALVDLLRRLQKDARARR